MEITNKKVPVIKENRLYMCSVMQVTAKGGSRVVYVTEDGVIIKTEPTHRYKNRENQRRRKENL